MVLASWNCFICFSGQCSGFFLESLTPPHVGSLSLLYLNKTTTDRMVKCRTVYEFHTLWASAASAGTVLNASFMFLHNVLQCSTHGMCCLCIGSLIIMTVWQIALWVVQGIILFPSGEVRERSAEVLLVSWLLH